MDTRFQPPSDRFNIDKQDGLMYKTIKDYDKESKKTAEVHEELKVHFFSKIRTWILVTLMSNFILIATSISTVSMWVAKKESKDNRQDEKIEEVKKGVSDIDGRVTIFISNDNVIKEKNTNFWLIYGTRITILETENKLKK